MATDWHKMEEQEILDHFTVESAEKGIPQFRVAAIQRKFGENLITPMHKPGIWEYLGSQISVLISTAIIAGCFAGTVYVHESSTSFIIHMILCVLMFVYPIYSAFKSKNHDTEFANSDLIIPKTHVVRDSSMQQISSVDLVPGDIISFGAGEKVPADIRILTADKLLIDEGILTGVSDPKKCDAEVSKENLIQPTNMAWCGCTITGGSGSGIVVATGKNIKLASQEQNLAYNRLPVSEAKDLVENSVYGIVFGILSLVLLVIASLWSIDDGYDPFGKIAFLLCITCFSLSRNIANMPQQFYEFLLAAYRAQGILIKSGKTLTAISDVNVVVSELKDVLTPNEISFSRVWQNGKIVHRAGDQVVRLLALVIDEFAQTPVEKALIDMIERRADMSQIKQENKQIQTIPTEEELKSSATLNLVDNKRMLIVLGPSDKMSSKWTQIMMNEKVEDITPELTISMNEARVNSATVGMVSVTLAYKVIHSNEDLEIEGLTFLAFIDLMDMPRTSTKPFLKTLTEHNMKIFISTAGALTTSLATCRIFGYARDISNEEMCFRDDMDRPDARKLAHTISMTGNDFQFLVKRPEMEDLVQKQSFVLYRANQAHKQMMSSYLIGQGHTVAYIGYGITDELALKQADVGIAFGPKATQVARDAASVVIDSEQVDVIGTMVIGAWKMKYILSESLLALVNVPALTLIVLSLAYGFQLSSIGCVLLSVNIFLPASSAFWGTGVYSEEVSVHLPVISGLQASVAASAAALYTFFHWLVDGASLEQAQTAYLYSAVFAEWVYYGTITAKFFLEGFDFQHHLGLHLGMLVKVVLLSILMMAAGFEIQKTTHFLLPAINYFAALWGLHLVFGKLLD